MLRVYFFSQASFYIKLYSLEKICPVLLNTNLNLMFTNVYACFSMYPLNDADCIVFWLFSKFYIKYFGPLVLQ